MSSLSEHGEYIIILKNEMDKSEVISFDYMCGTLLSPRPPDYVSGADGITIDIVQFKMVQEYFKPAAGGLLVYISCGSGLFSRKFAESGTYLELLL